MSMSGNVTQGMSWSSERPLALSSKAGRAQRSRETGEGIRARKSGRLRRELLNEPGPQTAKGPPAFSPEEGSLEIRSSLFPKAETCGHVKTLPKHERSLKLKLYWLRGRSISAGTILE